MSFPTLPLTLLAWSEQVLLLVSAGALASLAIASPKARLAMWQGLLLVLLLLPVVEPWRTPLMVQPLTLAASAPVALTRAAAVAAPPAAFHWRLEYWLWLIGAGAALRLLWVAVGFLRLQRYRRQARPLPEPPLRFASSIAAWYTSDSVSGPVTYGWRRPVILLPSKALELPAELREAIECHELIHVHRGDWLWVLAETLVRSLLWFHPAIWFVVGRIQLTREQVVDREAIDLLRNRERYLDALVAVASYQLESGLAPAFLRKRHLLARVEEVTKEITMSRSKIIAGITAVCSALPLAVLAGMWLFPFVGPPQSQAQTSPDSPGVTVDAGAALLHRAAVHTPEGLTATGKVILEATLDSKGEVSDARVVSGPPELRKEALASVLQWHYQPGPAVAQISIQFGSAAATASLAPSASGTAAPARVVVPRAATAAPPVAESSTNTLNSIQFAGISPEAEQTLRNQLTVREGQTISRQDMAAVTETIRAFDSHLRSEFTVGNGGAAVLHITAPAGPGVTYTTGVAGGRGGGPAVAPGVVAAAAQPLPAGVYKPGGDVTNPIPISRPEPQMSEEARKAKWGGTVLLSLVINENGMPQDIKIIKPLGLGLDEKAIEAVQQWRFRPGTKAGVPVSVAAQIEVTFRNLD